MNIPAPTAAYQRGSFAMRPYRHLAVCRAHQVVATPAYGGS